MCGTAEGRKKVKIFIKYLAELMGVKFIMMYLAQLVGGIIPDDRRTMFIWLIYRYEERAPSFAMAPRGEREEAKEE